MIAHVTTRCPSRRTQRQREKAELMEFSPYCKACGCELSDDPSRPNHGHLVRHFLSCPAHVKHVRKLAKHGESEAMYILTEKGRQWLQDHPEPPPAPLFSLWLVDGMPFTSEESAVGAAARMAEELGSSLEIFVAYVQQRDFKRVQVVRPNGSRIRKG